MELLNKSTVNLIEIILLLFCAFLIAVFFKKVKSSVNLKETKNINGIVTI